MFSGKGDKKRTVRCSQIVNVTTNARMGFTVPFVFGCFRCTQCCGDGKDEIAKECANFEKKCKVRSAPCSNVPTTAPERRTRKTTQPGGFKLR